MKQKNCQLRAYAQHVLAYNSWTTAIALHYRVLSADIVAALCATAADISHRFPGVIAQA